MFKNNNKTKTKLIDSSLTKTQNRENHCTCPVQQRASVESHESVTNVEHLPQQRTISPWTLERVSAGHTKKNSNSARQTPTVPGSL